MHVLRPAPLPWLGSMPSAWLLPRSTALPHLPFPPTPQDVGAQLCSAPAAAGGRALYDAFLAGGAGAQAALGALMEHTCPAGVDTDAAIEGAFSEFLYSAGLWNPAAALRWARQRGAAGVLRALHALQPVPSAAELWAPSQLKQAS